VSTGCRGCRVVWGVGVPQATCGCGVRCVLCSGLVFCFYIVLFFLLYFLDGFFDLCFVLLCGGVFWFGVGWWGWIGWGGVGWGGGGGGFGRGGGSLDRAESRMKGYLPLAQSSISTSRFSGLKVAVEIDGLAFPPTGRRLPVENRASAQDAIALAVLQVLRFTLLDLTEYPNSFLATKSGPLD